MRLQYTHRFERAYGELSDKDAERVRKALLELAENPRHPSLRVKKIQGTDNIWEARAGLSIRMTLEIFGDSIILRNVGPHNHALKKP